MTSNVFGGMLSLYTTTSTASRANKTVTMCCAAAESGRHEHHSKADDDTEDSPLLAMFQMEEKRHQQSGGTSASVKKDVPHLNFEITSDDGFHVESDSLTSNCRCASVRDCLIMHKATSCLEMLEFNNWQG